MLEQLGRGDNIAMAGYLVASADRSDRGFAQTVLRWAATYLDRMQGELRARSVCESGHWDVSTLR
jgi:hypothetical protein